MGGDEDVDKGKDVVWGVQGEGDDDTEDGGVDGGKGALPIPMMTSMMMMMMMKDPKAYIRRKTKMKRRKCPMACILSQKRKGPMAYNRDDRR